MRKPVRKRRGFDEGGYVDWSRDPDNSEDPNAQRLSSDSEGKSIMSGFTSVLGMGLKAGKAKGGKVKKVVPVKRKR